MKRVFAPVSVIVTMFLIALVSTTGFAQDSGAAKDPKVAAFVNGHNIMESEVQGLLQQIMQSQSRGMPPSPEQQAEFTKMYRDRVLERMVQDQLLKDEVAKQKIEVSDKELKNAVSEQLELQIISRGGTRKDYEENVLKGMGQTWDQVLDKAINEPGIREIYATEKLIKKRYPDKVKVSDAEIRTFYDDNLKRLYTSADEVKASHILLSTRKVSGEEEKGEVQQKAMEILALVKAPGANFEALAEVHSACPSGERGGDLGFFTRERMVAPFSNAAFAMEPGQVSDLVETEFGYHIIKVTDKREGKVTPFEQASLSIRKRLEVQKVRDETKLLVDQLMKTAKIQYP